MDASLARGAATVAALVVALGACGISGAQGSVTQDSGAPETTTGAEGADGGPEKFGVINIAELSFEAYFDIATPLPVPAVSRQQTIDTGAASCTYWPPPTTARFTDPDLVSAGTLTLIVGVESPLTFSPPVDNSVIDYGARLPVAFAEGSTFTLTASGAVVPAFSMAVRMPDPIAFTAPSISTDPNAPPLPISQSADFRVAWTGGASGIVDVQVTGSPDAGLTYVECFFPESAGAGSIPATLLARLPPGPSVFTASTKTNPTLVVADWSIGLNAYVEQPLGGSAVLVP